MPRGYPSWRAKLAGDNEGSHAPANPKGGRFAPQRWISVTQVGSMGPVGLRSSSRYSAGYVKVNDDTIQGVIAGQKQFVVPIWQRQYTWKQAQHDQLWSDLIRQYEADQADGASGGGHFFGTIVLAPKDPSATGVNHFLIIDGQQRLATLMLILCAVRDEAADRGDHSVLEKYNELFLLNKFAEGDDRFRLLPTEEDRDTFVRWVRRDADSGAGDLVSEAYRQYRGAVREFATQKGDDALDALGTVAATRLEIVEITTQHGDDVHRIFQSLNGTGVELDQADLLRNHLFMLLPTSGETIYEQVWRPMEKSIGVTNLEGLARVDLSRRGQVVARDRVYFEHQKLLSPLAGNEEAVEERVRDLANRALQFKRLIDPASESDDQLSAGLARLARWRAQTTHPVLMVGLDLRERGLLTSGELGRAVELIESFLVRRQLARIPTNALNRLFVQLVPRLPEDDTFVEALHYELSRDRLYWTSDDGVRESVKGQPFYHIGRGNQRKLILERLERSFGHPEVVDFQEVELQVEHVMPQTLTAEWRLHLEGLGEDADLVHSELVHTLGNLTLTAFNGTLSNDPFERKVQIYGDSHLELNQGLAENEAWGRKQILTRAAKLAEQVIEVWPAPMPGVSSHQEGFDWNMIDTAIERIPPGRWTSYGELAELAGTAAVPVGQHVKALPEGSKAYRVLASDGTVSSGFQWADPEDRRDVREILAAEGIVFEGGAARVDQKLSVEELTALVEDAQEED